MAFGFAPQLAVPDDQSPATVQPPVPAAPPVAMPAPQAPPQAQQGEPYKPGVLDILQGMIFDGQSPAEAAMAARQRNYQAQQMQFMAQALQNAPPEQRLGMLLNPGKMGEEWAKNFATNNAPEGSTTSMFGGAAHGGTTTYNPKTGFDEKSGRPYVLTPRGSAATGPSLGGDVSVSPTGAVVSGRLGLTGQSVSLPQIVAPGSVPNTFTPQLNMGGGQTAGGAPPPSPAMPMTAAANLNAPRGIRNNNFGNVKELPNGQKWNGQTGVDADGHVIFTDPAAGVRAAAINLQSYGHEGINTIGGIVQRWAGPKATPQVLSNYSHYLAGKLGVDPNQQLDLTDSKTQQGLLRGIFDFENGPQAMAGFRYQRTGQGQTQAQQQTAPGFSGPPAKTPRLLGLDDPRYKLYPPGTVLQESATGEITPQSNGAYGPDQVIGLRTKLADTEPVKNFNIAKDAYGAMVRAAAQPNGGMRGYAMKDTFARLINPGAVARVGTINAISEAQGIPANVKAYVMNLQGEGNVPPEIVQQILDISHGFLAAHHASAKSLNDNYGDFAVRHGMNPAEVQAPGIGDAAPGTMRLGPVPAAPQRQVGTIYATPKGPMVWAGTGWKPFQ